MSNERRAPTEATVKVDPSIEIHKSLYPYINYKNDGLTPYIESFKRSVASFNPFAVQQVATSDRVAVGSRLGARWYWPDAYPNTVYFDQHWPSHYDPFKDTRRKFHYGVKHATHAGDQLGIAYSFLPRFCQRTISTYKRCLVANNDNTNKCQQQQDEIISICPNWALDGLKTRNLNFLKVEALNNQKYREVMDVPAYNQGRTVANVPRRTWADGTSARLRPDTMWIDDRYVDINQKEIDQAKERIRQRNEARGIKKNDEVHLALYNRTYERPPEGVPLYP